jgi:hypothetical protein
MRSILYQFSRHACSVTKRNDSSLYTYTIHFLTLWHLSRLSLSSAELETLIIPALSTNFVQSLLLLAMGGRASLSTALPRLQSLDKSSIVTV